MEKEDGNASLGLGTHHRAVGVAFDRRHIRPPIEKARITGPRAAASWRPFLGIRLVRLRAERAKPAAEANAPAASSEEGHGSRGISIDLGKVHPIERACAAIRTGMKRGTWGGLALLQAIQGGRR